MTQSLNGGQHLLPGGHLVRLDLEIGVQLGGVEHGRLGLGPAGTGRGDDDPAATERRLDDVADRGTGSLCVLPSLLEVVDSAARGDLEPEETMTA